MYRSLKNNYHNFLRVLRPYLPDNAEYSELPYYPSSTTAYFEAVQTNYMLNILEGVQPMPSFDVIKIRLYKSATIQQHDYLSATVKASNGRKYHLAFERFGDVVIDENPHAAHGRTEAHAQEDVQEQNHSLGEPEPESAQLLGASSVTSLSLSMSQTDASTGTTLSAPSCPCVTPSESRGSRRRVKDEVVLINNKYRNVKDKLYRTLAFKHPAQPLPLSHLAVLAHTVHNMSLESHPFLQSWYSFAETLAKVIEVEYDAKVTTELEELGQIEGKNGKAEMSKSAAEYDEKSVNMDDLIHRFKEGIAKFGAWIHKYMEEQKARDDRLAWLEKRTKEMNAEIEILNRQLRNEKKA